jgi:tRNA threonylcarbamoyladenosine biosynthesis protein TsaE
MPDREVARALITTTSQPATEELGEALAPLLAVGDTLVLSGDLGAGKTQLTKGIGRGLGVAEPVTSPTFNILIVHGGRLPLYHFDLYRLETAEQLDDLDYWGTLESDGVAVVEWGDRFAGALPADGVVARIAITADETRELELTALGARGARLIAQWVAAAEAVPGATVALRPPATEDAR